MKRQANKRKAATTMSLIFTYFLFFIYFFCFHSADEKKNKHYLFFALNSPVNDVPTEAAAEDYAS